MQFVNYFDDTDWCNCDVILKYNDISLQAKFVSFAPLTSFAFVVEAYDQNDNFIADVTSGFSLSVYKIGSDNYWANINSFRIADALCQSKCFRLKISILGTFAGNTRKVFESFTDCMKIDNCCILAGDITYSTSENDILMLEYSPSDYSQNDYA